MSEEPIKPLDSDCCGQGCNPCVFDIYETELKIYRRNKPQRDRIIDKLILSDEYTDFRISEIIPVTSDVALYRFALPHSRATVGFLPGQHVIVKIIRDGCSIFRQFSILEEREGSFDLLIKLYPQGRFTSLISNLWSVGEMVPMRGPFGNYVYSKRGRIVMFVAGTGIIPIMSIVRAALNDENDETVFDLAACFRSVRDILCLEELKSFAEFWNFKLSFYLSQNNPADSSLRIQRYASVFPSRIDRNNVVDRVCSSLETDSLFIVCGSTTFESIIIKWIKEARPSADVFRF